MPHQIIHSASLSQGQLLEVNGAELISNYIVLKTILEKYIPDSPVVLAEPVKNPKADRINWFSNFEGGFVLLKALPPKKQAPRRADVENFDKLVNDIARRLIYSDSAKDKKNGELLAGVLRSPESREYYVTGERIAIVGWGFARLVSLPVEALEAEAQASKGRGTEPRAKAQKAPQEPKPKVVYEAFRFFGFLKKVALGVFCGLVIGLLAIYALDGGRIFRAVKILVETPGLNGPAYDEKENYLSELRKKLEALRGDFKGQRKACLIFSQDDALAGNFGYLDGCWEARSAGHLNAYTGQTATFGFCYKRATKKAEFAVQESGEEDCRAPALAAYQEGRLVITAQSSAACGRDGEDSFPRFELSCAASPDGAQAACELTQRDERDSVFPVEFRKRANDS